jgi:hypothetical protein
MTQDDQLDDEIAVDCEIKGQDERVRQPAPIKISIDIGGIDGAFVTIKLIATMEQLITGALRATYDRDCNSCRRARASLRSAV